MELVGWAAPPRYDAVDPKLHWAKHPRFSDTDTLNYTISARGCRSVLIINVVAAIDELPAVFAAAPKVMSMVSFNGGHKYSDFTPRIDRLAAVGSGGLIAGKVMAKTGVLVTFLLLFKKAWIILLLPSLRLKTKIFRRKDDVTSCAYPPRKT